MDAGAASSLHGFLATPAGPVWAALSLTEGSVDPGAVVVLVPPFGWDGAASARSLRGWALRSAGHGVPVLRFHLPGTGDSPGDPVSQDLVAWGSALTGVVQQALRLTGAARSCVVGLGLGGVVAVEALRQGLEVDDLVLWAVPRTGRAVLRELRMLAALRSEPDLDGQTLYVNGYALPAGVRDQLAELDLAQAPSPRAAGRALVLGRGHRPGDPGVTGALANAGWDVSSAQGPGYDEMVVEPRLAQVPSEVIHRVTRWVTACPSVSRRPPDRSGLLSFVTVAGVSHEVLAVGTDHGPVQLQVARPAEAPAEVRLLLLSAAATPRTGPSELWTEAARRLAPDGCEVVRVDLPGVGESDGPDTWQHGLRGFYVQPLEVPLRQLLDGLETEAGPRHLVVGGLCSGAFWAARLALADDRVRSAVLLNPAALVWERPEGVVALARDLLHRAANGRARRDVLFVRDARREVLRDVWSNLRAVTRRAPSERSTEADSATDDELGARTTGHGRVLARLARRGVRLAVVLSPGEALEEVLPRTLPWTGSTILRLAGPPGAHTLAPAQMRSQALDALCDAVAALQQERA